MHISSRWLASFASVIRLLFVLTLVSLGTGLLSAQTVTVKVQGQTSQIVFAGRDPRYSTAAHFGSDRDSFPENQPPRVELPLQLGQAIQITAAGEVDLDVRSASRLKIVGPGGGTDSYTLRYQNYVSGIRGRWGALIGVFLPDQPQGSENLIANYRSAAEEVEVMEPLLQLPFLIGDGRTPSGVLRTFIVPRGATRLYLGILDGPVSNNSGEFTATVRVVPRPGSTAGLVNPVRLLGIGSASLAGYPLGTHIRGWDTTTISPVNDPVAIQLSTFGPSVRRLRIGAVGKVDLDSQRLGVSPNGLFTSNESFSADSKTGLSGLRAPAGSLVGVFLRDQHNPDERRTFTSEFGTAATRDATPLTPMIQQYFYIGSGRTTAGLLKEFEIPAGATRLILGVHDESRDRNSDNYGYFFIAVSPVADGLPEYEISRISNGASFQAGAVSAGSIATIMGQRLGGSAVAAATVPLPVILSGTRVWFDEYPAPLFFVSPGQINAQIPFELANRSAVQVVVSTGGPPGNPLIVPLAPASPGIFLYGDSRPVIVNAATGQLVAESGQIRRGDTLVIYATGLGATTTMPPAGVPASLTELSRVLAEVKVVIAGISVDPFFAGLAPGFVGVYQVNVVIPGTAPGGQATLYLRSGAAESNKVTLSIEN